MNKAPETWRDRHRGLLIEAIHDGHHWCGYVYVPIDSPPNEKTESVWLTPVRDEKSGLSMYRISRSPILANCPCHGGLSFYTKRINDRTHPPQGLEQRSILVGWDYNHDLDMYLTFTLDGVMEEARRVADYFIEELGIDVEYGAYREPGKGAE